MFWIVLLYCRKRADSAGVQRFKCRGVVLGNQQKTGISTAATYAPVISIPGVRMLITESIASGSGVNLFDLSNAFLNALSTKKQTMAQAQERAGGSSGNKGVEAMNAAIETATTLKEHRS